MLVIVSKKILRRQSLLARSRSVWATRDLDCCAGRVWFGWACEILGVNAVVDGKILFQLARMPEVYEDLRRLAELLRARTAHTPALVHEAFLRLIGEKNLVWQNRSHFIGIFARVMRQTLTNYAVARHRLKRGGSDPLRLTLEFYDSRKIDVTALDQALQALEALDERQARIVELRFFAGLTVEETAELLEISPATVKRDWTLAKIWLRRELSAN